MAKSWQETRREILDSPDGWTAYARSKEPKRKPSSESWLSDFLFVALVWLSGLFAGLGLYAACLR
jgi:hypothetical protein